MTNCSYFPNCTGCSSWNMAYSEQKMNKILRLESLLKEKDLEIPGETGFISCGEFGLRHRIDFTIEFDENLNTHNVGFYNSKKKITNITRCLQLDPILQDFYSEFTKFKFFYGEIPIKKGSVRLRVGPNREKGCWLDFSNIEVKLLLEDRKLLNEILEAGFKVEIGQKGKRLIRTNEGLRLCEPVPDFWFKTINSKKEDLNLKCLISDFTQPSWTTAAALVNVVMGWISQKKSINSVLEFGSGIGQFTLSFLQEGLVVDACEISESAANQLKLNSDIHQLNSNLTLRIGDFHKTVIFPVQKYDLIFTNPARSGLKKFTDEIIKLDPDFLIYVSCFPESMIEDISSLSKRYALCNIIIVDQFPQTKHFETCMLLKKLN